MPRTRAAHRFTPSDRSVQAAVWQRWYGTSRWKRKRLAQLRAHPFCIMCESEGVITLASVADHVIAHKGDEVLFWTGELQSLCKPHHDSDKRMQELGSVARGCDADGWPLSRGDLGGE